jgi:hypothetical protein
MQYGEDCDAGDKNGPGGFCTERCTFVLLACWYEFCGCYANGQDASNLYGQFNTANTAPVYSKSAVNNGGSVSAYGFAGPRGIAVNPKQHLLYVADTNNHRVLAHRLSNNGSSAESVGEYC